MNYLHCPTKVNFQENILRKGRSFPDDQVSDTLLSEEYDQNRYSPHKFSIHMD